MDESTPGVCRGSLAFSCQCPARLHTLRRCLLIASEAADSWNRDEILGARWFVWISPCRRLDASLEDLASHTEGDGAGASDDTRALLQNKWRGVLSVNYSHTPSDADSAYRLLTTILPLESPGFSDFTFEIAEGPAIPWDEAGFASLEAIVERVEVARRSGRDTTVSGWKKRDPDQPSGSYLASGHFQVYYLAPLACSLSFCVWRSPLAPG